MKISMVYLLSNSNVFIILLAPQTFNKISFSISIKYKYKKARTSVEKIKQLHFLII